MKFAANLVVAGRFKLVRELTGGGAGEVTWLATHVELDVPCVVMLIDGPDRDDAALRERFARRAKAAAQLRGSNVVQMFDHGVWEGVPYLVTEHLEGESLADRLRRDAKLKPGDCMTVAGQVARALRRAHAAGIVHRDLSPESVFFALEDDHEVVKLLDFGVVNPDRRAAGAAGGPARAGRAAPYASPEALSGAEPSAGDDQWSLAVLLFECLTGVHPFAARSVVGGTARVLNGLGVTPSEAGAAFGPELDRWWARATAPEPSARFSSVRALVEGLGDALQLGISLGGEISRTSVRIRAELLAGVPPSGRPPVPSAAPSSIAPVSGRVSEGPGARWVPGGPPSAPPSGRSISAPPSGQSISVPPPSWARGPGSSRRPDAPAALAAATTGGSGGQPLAAPAATRAAWGYGRTAFVVVCAVCAAATLAFSARSILTAPAAPRPAPSAARARGPGVSSSSASFPAVAVSAGAASAAASGAASGGTNAVPSGATSAAPAASSSRPPAAPRPGRSVP